MMARIVEVMFKDPKPWTTKEIVLSIGRYHWPVLIVFAHGFPKPIDVSSIVHKLYTVHFLSVSAHHPGPMVVLRMAWSQRLDQRNQVLPIW